MLGWLKKVQSWWQRPAPLAIEATPTPAVPRLERIVLTEGVVRTLFEDYREHRHSERGDEEIGWILLGTREKGIAQALAALPAGAQRDAGAAHIQFNSEAQALASRILRLDDKRLQIVGVVHTHPGSLRRPSAGDFAGDRVWVTRLRDGEGVFAIGTADPHVHEAVGSHVQLFAGMCFCWYALAAGDGDYRPLPVRVMPGPDRADALRPVWDVIESHAESLNRLCRQFARVEVATCGVADEPSHAVVIKIALADANQKLRVLLSEGDVRYYWDRGGELIAIDPHEPCVERAVYLILAELAKEAAPLTMSVE